MNLRAIGAVASNTFKESARNRVLYALVGATLTVSALSYVLASVTAGGDSDPAANARRVRIVTDVSLSAIALIGALCAIFLGTNLVYQEVERRTVYTILARPIGRFEFILGKFLGLASVVVAAVSVMAVGFAVILCVYAGSTDPLSWKHALAIAFTGVELVVVVAIALVFSSIAHPIEGAIFAFVVTLAGHATANLNAFGEELTKPHAGGPPGGAAVLAAKALHAVYLVLPNLENFNFRADAVHDLPIDPRVPVASLAYAGLYLVVLLALATAGFQRKVL